MHSPVKPRGGYLNLLRQISNLDLCASYITSGPSMEDPGPSSGVSSIDEDDLSGQVPREGRMLMTRGGYSDIYIGTLHIKGVVAPIKVCTSYLGLIVLMNFVDRALAVFVGRHQDSYRRGCSLWNE